MIDSTTNPDSRIVTTALERDYFAQFAAWDEWTDRAERLATRLLLTSYIYAVDAIADEDSAIELHFADWNSFHEAEMYLADYPQEFNLIDRDALDIDDYVLWVDWYADAQARRVNTEVQS